MTALMNRTALDNPLTGRPDGERPDQPVVPEDGHPVREAERIAVAVRCTFPGPCEVVPHDLRRPDSAIRIIENNLSGRQVGDSATELSLRRIAGPRPPRCHPELQQPVPRWTPAQEHLDRHQSAEGRYVVALCPNLDVNTLSPAGPYRGRPRRHGFRTAGWSSGGATCPQRTRAPPGLGSFAAQRFSTPRGLNHGQKHGPVRGLNSEGLFETRSTAELIAGQLRVSRATVYDYTKQPGL
ncbi:PAS domain-containing protein [Streptomyces sp. MJP52]|uniref:PAS domain-containing protein n=1 Tax=Streptomyces sp. MJP52 TaxID=2940555 RepID=UPI0032AF3D8C